MPTRYLQSPHPQQSSSLHGLSWHVFPFVSLLHMFQGDLYSLLWLLQEMGRHCLLEPASLSSRKQQLHSKLVRQLIVRQSTMGLQRKNNPVLRKLEGVREKNGIHKLAKHPKMISWKMRGMETHTSPSPSSHLQARLSEMTPQARD